MSLWSNNNLASVTTWIALLDLNQLDKVFKDSKDIKMEELTFWNHADSHAMREVILKGLSIQIDNYFTRLRGARYEDDSNRDKALTAMQSVLADASKTVEELAQICDTHYKFFQEGRLDG